LFNQCIELKTNVTTLVSTFSIINPRSLYSKQAKGLSDLMMLKRTAETLFKSGNNFFTRYALYTLHELVRYYTPKT